MLDRSRSSMSGRSEIRFSIVGVAVNVETRWRSMTSTISAASNFCMITRRSPPSMLFSVVNPVEWYIGATTRIVCGVGTGPHIAIIGVVNTSWYTAGRLITMTFGIPVDPLLQMPINDGDTTSGRSSGGASLDRPSSDGKGSQPPVPGAMRSSIHVSIDGDVRLVEIHRGVDRLAQPGALPVGEVPAHGHRDRPELPGGDRRRARGATSSAWRCRAGRRSRRPARAAASASASDRGRARAT